MLASLGSVLAHSESLLSRPESKTLTATLSKVLVVTRSMEIDPTEPSGGSIRARVQKTVPPVIPESTLSESARWSTPEPGTV